jgi:prepilin peptidase CpaA
MAGWLPFVPLVVMLLVASVLDLRERRIPNWLTLSLLVGGMVQAGLGSGTVSPASSGLGILVGFVLMFLPFALGALGGGDVKLLAAVGAWLGPMPTVGVFAAAAVVGMIIVLAQCALTGRLSTLFRNSSMLAMNVVSVRHLGPSHLESTASECRSVEKPLPYAIPILLGTVLVLAWH